MEKFEEFLLKKIEEATEIDINSGEKFLYAIGNILGNSKEYICQITYNDIITETIVVLAIEDQTLQGGITILEPDGKNIWGCTQLTNKYCFNYHDGKAIQNVLSTITKMVKERRHERKQRQALERLKETEEANK